MTVYDSIGGGYDTTRRADPYIVSRLLHHLKGNNGRYLDLACGTGNYTQALKQQGMDITGIDVSEYMLQLARDKNSSIDWVLGSIESLPFPDNAFSGAICIQAIHHLQNLESAIKEAARVITGSVVIFTAIAEQLENYWLNEYFPEAMRKSIQQMPGEEVIYKALRGAGFRRIWWEPYEIRDSLQDFFLYSGKHNPEIYLDAGIRKGISTFASLAEPGEIEQGCARLKADIGSGKILRVMESYSAWGKGDYMFIAGNK